MNKKAKESLNKAGNICLFVKENSGDEQTARYMAEAIAEINEAVKCYETEKLEWEAVARAQDKAQTVMMEEIERLRAPGSVSALREALARIENLADDYDQCVTKAGALDSIYDLAHAALAPEKG